MENDVLRRLLQAVITALFTNHIQVEILRLVIGFQEEML